MKLVTLRTILNPAEAQLLKSRLEAAGITVYANHELASLSMEGYSLSTGGIQLQVSEEDLQSAREILASGEDS